MQMNQIYFKQKYRVKWKSNAKYGLFLLYFTRCLNVTHRHTQNPTIFCWIIFLFMYLFIYFNLFFEGFETTRKNIV